MQIGWEVVKIKKPSTDIVLKNHGYKTIYIIDDAQQYEEQTIMNLLNKANKNNKIIIAQTFSGKSTSESVVITQLEAVKAIYEHYLKNSQSVTEIIREPNRRIGRNIGDFYLETPLKFVLDVALRESTPWLFNYSLRGGWAETKNQYNTAKEHGNTHLLLAIISLYQIISLDMSVPINHLYEASYQFGYTNDWVNSSLDYLFKQNMIISTQEIRVLHLQNAIRILVRHIEEIFNSENDVFYSIIKDIIVSISTPLKGVFWLFDLFFRYDAKYIFIENTLDENITRHLIGRCFSQDSLENISHAGFVIDRVLWSNGIKYRKLIDEHGEILKEWINSTNNITAISLARILNNMVNEDKAMKESFVNMIDKPRISGNLKNINRDSLYAWGDFLNRLAIYQKKKWIDSFYLLFPKHEIHQALSSITNQHIYGAVKLLSALLCYNKEFAHTEMIYCLSVVKRYLELDFSDALEQFDLDFRMYFMGQGLFEFQKPSALQKATSQAFVLIISSEMISNCILKGSPRDWHNLYSHSHYIQMYDKEKWSSAINLINLTDLNRSAEGLWQNQPDEFLMLLIMLYTKAEDVDNWIFDNRYSIDVVKTNTIVLSPKTAEYICANGKPVMLIDVSHYSWETSAKALSVLKKYSTQACRNVVYCNDKNIIDSLLTLTPLSWENYHVFFSRLLRFEGNYVRNMLSRLDCDLLRDKWMHAVISPTYSNYNIKKGHVSGFLKLIKMIRSNSDDASIICTVNEIEDSLMCELDKKVGHRT